MTVIADQDGTLQPTTHLWQMHSNGCLPLEQLNEMLLACAPYPWVSALCEVLQPNERFIIITGRGIEHAEVTEQWIKRYVPHSPIHVQLLGDDVWLPGETHDQSMQRYRDIKGQALDDAIAIASSCRKIGEWILVLEDDPGIIAYVLAKHSRVLGLVLGAIGGLGRIHVVHRNGSGALDKRWLQLARVMV